MDMMHKNTANYVILSLLSGWPEGLSAQRILHLAHSKRSMANDTPSIILSAQKKKKNVKIIGRSACEGCGQIRNIYVLTKKGSKELEGAI